MTELATVEARRLSELEGVVDSGLRTFVDVGNALAEIRDSRLYRDGFDTFEAYCSARFDLSRPRVYQLIDAALVVDAVSTNVDIAAPASESVARELAPLRGAPAVVAEVWERVTEAHGPKPTAREVREVVQTYKTGDAPAPPAPTFTCCPTCGQRVRADRPLKPQKELNTTCRP